MTVFDNAALFCSLAVEALTHYLPPINYVAIPSNITKKIKKKKMRVKYKHKADIPRL